MTYSGRHVPQVFVYKMINKYYVREQNTIEMNMLTKPIFDVLHIDIK